MRILFAGGGTGGHLYPALAIARQLQALNPSVEPFFIGARRGIERDILPTTGFPHTLLELHPIYRSAPWQNWKTLTGAVSAWRELTRVIREQRPALLVGTGGYAMGLAALHARLHRVPVVQQVADSHPGLTARLVARWSRRIYLGFPEAKPHFGQGADTRDTGNPIEPPPSPLPAKGPARAKWGFPESGGTVLVVFGGSQGARAVNEAMDAWIERGLPPNLFVIWGTGKGNIEDHRHRESERVRVLPYLSPIGDAYAACDLAVARAGAMSTAELSAWGIPTLLVPLPTAAQDHQTSNAEALQRAGAAVHIPQSQLSPDRLSREVTGLLEAPDRLEAMRRAALERSRPDAAEVIARDILELLDMK